MPDLKPPMRFYPGTGISISGKWPCRFPAGKVLKKAGPMHETKSRFAGLQLARGIAAMLVTLYHTSNHLRLDFGYLPMQGIFISDVQASIFSLF
jgi:hypothetical protein